MVWTKQEFEREVRRQLVELASIRKRVPMNAEVLARIDRLEQSHKNLLKKLNEYFKTSPRLDERCATCGELLIASILAGREAVMKGKAWHHKACVHDGQGCGKSFGKPAFLN